MKNFLSITFHSPTITITRKFLGKVLLKVSLNEGLEQLVYS